MSTNLNELDPDSPEYEAAAEAAQQAEDEAHGRAETAPEDGSDAATEQAGEGEPTGEPTGEAAEQPTGETPPADKPEAEATPPTDETPPAQGDGKPGGVLAKDGKTVLPYGALKGAREEARRERQGRESAEARARELEQQIADLKAGKTPADGGAAMTEEQEAELVTDYPALKPVFARLKATQAELDALKTAKPAAAEAADESDPAADLQEAIDSVPLLAEWQSDQAHAAKWDRAKAIDASLVGSPKWKGKPLTERLGEVAKRVAEEFDIEVAPTADKPKAKEDTPPTKPPTTQRQTPKEAIDKAGRAPPNTLSDFKGGAADPSKDVLERMPVAKQAARVAEMSDDEIDAWLQRVG